MTTTLTIRDEPLGGEARDALVLELLTDEITVRELIRERVHQEVKDFNARPHAEFGGLVRPTDLEHRLNGERRREPVDWRVQFDHDRPLRRRALRVRSRDRRRVPTIG